jgi:hypothetical protein
MNNEYDDDHYRHLKKRDMHLAGETESIAWLKAVPPIVDRVPKGMGKTSAKHPRNNKPPTTPEAA